MKKTLLTVLCLLLFLSSCGKKQPSGDNGLSVQNDPQIIESTEPFLYDDPSAYVASHLTDDFSITYSVQYTGSEAYSMSMTRTAAGYYLAIAGSAMLFIKNGDKYDVYVDDRNDNFTLVDYLDNYSEEEVQTQISTFFVLMTCYSGSEQNMVKTGTNRIAGRECDSYALDYSNVGMDQSFIYSIDKATGVCLKYCFDIGSSQDNQSFSFECQEFKVGGVSLPAYGS